MAQESRQARQQPRTAQGFGQRGPRVEGHETVQTPTWRLRVRGGLLAVFDDRGARPPDRGIVPRVLYC
jgi:hypothetical protein